MKRRDFLSATAATAAASLLPLHGARAAQAKPKKKPTLREKVLAHNQALIEGLFRLDKPLHPWRWIVVHHTAAESASLEGVSRYHAKRFEDPLGIQYHFLIGNGKKKPTGWIEVGRWQHQARAIHLFNPDKAPDAVAICLVGNFEERKPHRRQIDALTMLTRALMARLKIDVAHVTTHTGVDGRLTQCPGKHFPLKRYLADLAAETPSPFR